MGRVLHTHATSLQPAQAIRSDVGFFCEFELPGSRLVLGASLVLRFKTRIFGLLAWNRSDKIYPSDERTVKDLPEPPEPPPLQLTSTSRPPRPSMHKPLCSAQAALN